MDLIDDTLTECFERERRGLLAHAYRMLGGDHEAEDVVQDTYLRAMRGWDGFGFRALSRGLEAAPRVSAGGPRWR